METLMSLVDNGAFSYLLAALVLSQVVMTVNLYLYRGQVSRMKLFSWSKKDGLSFLPIEFFDKSKNKKPPPRQEGAD